MPPDSPSVAAVKEAIAQAVKELKEHIDAKIKEMFEEDEL